MESWVNPDGKRVIQVCWEGMEEAMVVEEAAFNSVGGTGL